jgi:hypothetical protein
LPHRPRLERREIGAGIGLGEHGGRQHFARGELRQPFALLFLGAGADDQFGGDLGARAERANPDITARELLGHHAHGFLAEAQAAILFRDGEAEHAEVGHLREDLERDIAVGAVPLVRLRRDLAVGELAHLIADRRQGLVETTVADRGAMMRPHQLDQACAALDIASSVQFSHRPRQPRGDRLTREPDVGGPHDFALTHGNAALNLGEVFTDADLDEQFLGLAETAAGMHPLGIGRELAHRLHIGREPGKTMGGALLAVEQPVDHTIVDRHPLAHGGRCLGQQCVDRVGRFPCERDKLRSGVGALSLVQHRRSPRGSASRRIPLIGIHSASKAFAPTLRVHCTNATPQREFRPHCRQFTQLMLHYWTGRGLEPLAHASPAPPPPPRLMTRPRTPAGACSLRREPFALLPECCGCGRRIAVSRP